MTESDKRKIEELWLQGYGSTKIADKLGINVNTVKSFCRRHGLAGDRQQERKTGDSPGRGGNRQKNLCRIP